jgi:hypothetical protein
MRTRADDLGRGFDPLEGPNRAQDRSAVPAGLKGSASNPEAASGHMTGGCPAWEILPTFGRWRTGLRRLMPLDPMGGIISHVGALRFQPPAR